MKKVENSCLSENDGVLKSISDAEIKEMKYKDNIFLKLFKTKSKNKIFYKIVLSLVFFCSGWFCYFASSLNINTEDVLLLDVDDEEENVDLNNSKNEESSRQNVNDEKNKKSGRRKIKKKINKSKKTKNRNKAVNNGKVLSLKNDSVNSNKLKEKEKKQTKIRKVKDAPLKKIAKKATKEKSRFSSKPKKKSLLKKNLAGEKLIKKNKNFIENKTINTKKKKKKKRKKKPNFKEIKNKAEKKLLNYELDKNRALKSFLRRNIFKNSYNSKNKNFLDVPKKLKFKSEHKHKIKPKTTSKTKLKTKSKIKRTRSKRKKIKINKNNVLSNLEKVEKKKDELKNKNKKINILVEILKKVFNKKQKVGREDFIKKVGEFCLDCGKNSLSSSFKHENKFEKESFSGVEDEERLKSGEIFKLKEDLTKSQNKKKSLSEPINLSYYFDGDLLKFFNLNNKKTLNIKLDELNEKTRKIFENKLFNFKKNEKNKTLLNSGDEVVSGKEENVEISYELDGNIFKFKDCDDSLVSFILNEQSKKLLENFLWEEEVDSKFEKESFSGVEDEERLKSGEILKLKEDLTEKVREQQNKSNEKCVQYLEKQAEEKDECVQEAIYEKNLKNRNEKDLSDSNTACSEENVYLLESMS